MAVASILIGYAALLWVGGPLALLFIGLHIGIMLLAMWRRK